jgi:hypothetical protein
MTMKTNKLIIATGLTIALAGCGGPQVTAMQGPSGGKEYLVDCGHHGFDGGDWAQCYSEATRVCPSGYAIHDKSQEAGPVFATSGAKRTLLVACKV